MKKLFALLFAAGLVTAASAQSGSRYRNDSRAYNNSYQASPYSNHYSNYNQYDRRYWIERNRRQAERQRYEMMRRKQARYYNQRVYSPYGYSRKPVFQLSIGIGGRK